MDEIERTSQDASRTIEQTAAVLEQAKSMLSKGEAALREAGAQPGELRTRLLEKLPSAKGLLEYAEQQLKEEIERDLPQQSAPARHSRPRPARQMV
ncbi:hypothetical protein [Belnapia arida]|nr:hypothetical protein [Belnapia arida]